MRILAFIIKCVVVIVIILAVASYISYLKTGRFWVPTISFSSVKSSLQSFRGAPVMQTLEAPDEDVYKWRVDGEWVYGDSPPEGVDAQRVGGDK